MEHLVTADKLAELQTELTELKTNGRLEIADRLKRAKELGDLSENSEYFEAREAQQQIERRIYELEEIIKNAKVLKMSHGKSTVQVGATIQVKKDGETVTFSIVGPNEADPAKGKISNESPIGSSFIGKKPGDKVEVKVPSGKVVYEILKID